jgi:hypothetical protein
MLERVAFDRKHPLNVIPAQAGIHGDQKHRPRKRLPWVPAFAGTTLGYVLMDRRARPRA